MPSLSLVLTTDQRSELETRVRSGRGRADAAHRARVILLLADGCIYTTIATMTGCSSRTIALWKRRLKTDGALPNRRPVIAVRNRPSDAGPRSGHHEVDASSTTTRRDALVDTSLGRKLGVQHTLVPRAWQHAGLQPHRLERYMRSTDPA